MSKKSWVLAAAIVTVISLITIFILKWNRYQTVSPRRGSIIEAIYALGKVKAKKQFELKIGVFSTVEKIHVKEGESVKKNDPLVKFSESGVFKAPFDGVVTLVAIDEGESAAPSVVLLRIDDLSEKFVEASLEQQGALRVQKGQPVEIIFETLRGEKLQGKVSSLYSKNDEFIATIDVEGLRDNILPGMTADVAIIIGEHNNALLIPVKAVKNGYVFALRNKKEIKIAVKIGAIDSQMVEVVGGDLKESDQIIMRNQ